jgi:RNA polymerase sigma-70 factor (ECF subfamily)
MNNGTDSSEVSAKAIEVRRRFEREVLPLANDLHAVAMGYTRNLYDAAELVQETLLNAFKSYDRYTEQSYLKAWLLTILRNTWISRHRWRQNRPAENLIPDFSSFEHGATAPGEIPTVASAEQQALHLVLDADVEQALLTLPAESRETLYLVAVHNMSYHEVGEVMGISPNAVGSRMYRIRAVLRGQLADRERKPRTGSEPSGQQQGAEVRTPAA